MTQRRFFTRVAGATRVMRFNRRARESVFVLALLVAAMVPLSAGAPFPLESNHAPPAARSSMNDGAKSFAPGIGPGIGYVPPSVGQTTVLINNTVYPGLYRSVDTEDSGRYPEDWGTTPAYDPSTNLFYEPVLNVTENATAVYYGGYLAAISPATDGLVGLVPVGLIPEGVAFDSSN